VPLLNRTTDQVSIVLGSLGNLGTRSKESHTHYVKFLELSSSTEVHRIHMLKIVIERLGLLK